MPINLTRVFHQINTLKNKLFYDPEANETLTFMNLNDELLVIESGFFFSTSSNSSERSNAVKFPVGETITCKIAEYDDDGVALEDIIPLTTTLIFMNEKFKVEGFARPRELTKQWVLRLQAIGEYA